MKILHLIYYDVIACGFYLLLKDDMDLGFFFNYDED